MKYDEGLVRTMWSPGLEGMYGYFSDTGVDLRSHVENQDREYYGKVFCSDTGLGCVRPFRQNERGLRWTYFYPAGSGDPGNAAPVSGSIVQYKVFSSSKYFADWQTEKPRNIDQVTPVPDGYGGVSVVVIYREDCSVRE